MYDERIGQNSDVFSLGKGFNKPDLIFSSLYNLRMYILGEIRKEIYRQEKMSFWAKKTGLNSERKPAEITYKVIITETEKLYKINVTEKWLVAKNVHIEYIPKKLFAGIKVLENHGDKSIQCSYCQNKAMGGFTETVPGGIFVADVCEDCKVLVEEGRFDELS